jgi:hypothetical protein
MSDDYFYDDDDKANYNGNDHDDYHYSSTRIKAAVTNTEKKAPNTTNLVSTFIKLVTFARVSAMTWVMVAMATSMGFIMKNARFGEFLSMMLSMLRGWIVISRIEEVCDGNLL